MPLDLPYEILECILDYLHDDPETLRICSLVHRSWLPATRYHLLNPTIISQCCDHWTSEIENVTELLDLVSSPHCTILPAIEDVILFFAPSKGSSLLKEAIGILSEASSLKKVVFMNCGAAPIAWIAQETPNIQELVYEAGSEDSLAKQDAIPFLTSFTQLRSLSFYASRVTYTVPIPAGPVGNPFAFTLLRTLRLSIDHSDEFLGWLLEYHSYIALETLALDIYSGNHEGWEGVDNLNRFLKAQSKSLTHLSLGISYTDTNRVMDLTEKGAFPRSFILAH
ncbi:hypothetical protein EST38_g920 [Candolleomyces aberdarensis]|uniref:F-box domain-containing protein n=1 Tax=Candolleomyces aberdarensis TaxID=2316362 RepID=A0A4Q2DZY7_9AGAR|nr:hypothetical protein EST38_g920 [Candolleomyces aberdarensis]